ncbi:MAG: hypothetical protein V7709_03235 [Halioglobus sp.]
MTKNSTIKLRIPNQDLALFSEFELNAEAAAVWVQNLPAINTKKVVQQLRQAINDLNRVAMSPNVRFGIMEVLRPTLQASLAALSKRFLNQPLVLPEEPRQMSELAHTVLGLTTTAYTIVAAHTIQQRDSIKGVNPAKLVCEAIQRAINFSGCKILQSYQLNQPIERLGWLELHQLYALAERQKLTELTVADRLSGDGSIKDTYLRAVLLGCCKPNQLRQHDLAAIALGMQEWSTSVTLDDRETLRGFFQVDLSSDQAPSYRALQSDAPRESVRFIDSDALVRKLQTLRRGETEPAGTELTAQTDSPITNNLLDHLIGALGTMSKRNFSRESSGSALWITLGLSNAHYFISDGLTFEQLLYGADQDEYKHIATNPFLVPQKHHDAWDQANPHDALTGEGPDHTVGDITVDEATQANLDHHNVGTAIQPRHRAYPVNMVDSSPGGYCLEWSPELPSDVKTGDIVSVRVDESTDWAVATVCWVSQLKNAQTLIGVELLSPNAMPYGAKVIHNTGEEAESMRVLLLPEIKLVGQPHTLITPRAGFREHQKVSLVKEGEHFYIQLLRQIAATGSYAQFDFRYIKLLEDVIADDQNGPLGAAYDSLWTKI